MSDRLNDYFAREAGEYLGELEKLLNGSSSPEPDHFLRLATGVRGSAQMAEAEGVVVLAEALEDAARGLASGTMRWSEELHSLAAGTVHDLKELVTALGRWSSAEDERLRSAVSRWDRPGLASTESEMVGDAVPISDLFYDDAGPHIVESGHWSLDEEARPLGAEPLEVTATSGDFGSAEESDFTNTAPERSTGHPVAVPIGKLLYQGPAAIREALALRPRIQEAARRGPSTSLDELLEELFDLVELGMGSDRPE